jgi:hypothetical protein
VFYKDLSKSAWMLKPQSSANRYRMPAPCQSEQAADFPARLTGPSRDIAAMSESYLVDHLRLPFCTVMATHYWLMEV